MLGDRPALADAARGRLDDERLESIHETVSEVIEISGPTLLLRPKSSIVRRRQIKW
jgi:hypothetical protein